MCLFTIPFFIARCELVSHPFDKHSWNNFTSSPSRIVVADHNHGSKVIFASDNGVINKTGHVNPDIAQENPVIFFSLIVKLIVKFIGDQ